MLEEINHKSITNSILKNININEEIKYKLIINDNYIGNAIQFYHFKNYICSYCVGCYIENHLSQSVLMKMICYYEEFPEFYEIIINYIIESGLGIYSHIVIKYTNIIFTKQYFNIYFNISNMLLLKLL